MATADERAALLAVSCPWCSAPPGEECHVPNGADVGTRRDRAHTLRLTTLDGACHDARWRLAVGRSANVIAGAVAALAGKDADGEPLVKPAAATATAVLERPW